MTDLFKEYQVNDVDSLEEFNLKYYKPERYKEQGIGYMQTVLSSQRKAIDKQGYTIISKHDSITGRVVAYFPKQ